MAHFNEYLDFLKLSPLIKHFLQNGKKRLYKKGEFFCQASEVCHNIAYISQGGSKPISIKSNKLTILFHFKLMKQVIKLYKICFLYIKKVFNKYINIFLLKHSIKLHK